MSGNRLEIFHVFGILIVWTINIPIFLFRLIMALVKHTRMPPIRTLFYVPKVLDDWLIVIGLSAFFLAFILSGIHLHAS